MTGPSAAVAAVRVAVRRALADLAASAPVGVALSGGPDSLALLSAAVFERRPGTSAGVTALIADQHWHDGSAGVCARVAAVAERLGAAALVLDAPAPRDEAAAREARYTALEKAAADLGLAAVLVGHTADDQAETVLLGLLHGSGARSLGGMAPVRGLFRRPLLDVRREVTLRACADQGLDAYDDPANVEHRYARVRVRELTRALDRDAVPNLARTARLLRADADLLDALADDVRAEHPDGGLDCGLLAALPDALRTRVLHRLTPGLTAQHVAAVDALVTAWHGQGPVALPGAVAAVRRSGRIVLVPSRTSLSEQRA